jgi:hypothetical protein
MWHVGREANASAALHDLYNRAQVGAEPLEPLLCLFELA